MKFVSLNGNFEVVYNPHVGTPIGQYTKVGKLIDEEYDYINMGTYNYVFNLNEGEKPWILDMPQYIGSMSHLKYDILPYADRFVIFDGKEFGNIWL